MILHSLARMSRDQGRFDNAHAHIERAKLYMANNTYDLGHAMKLQGQVWFEQGKLQEAKSEALCAIGVFEKLGAAGDLDDCRKLLRDAEEKMEKLIVTSDLGFNGEHLETVLLSTPANSPSSARGNE